MFTGIIQAVGQITALDKRGSDVRLGVNVSPLDLSTSQLGDSIAVNGVCLTAVELSLHSFVADVSHETVSVTSLGALAVGAEVNIEKALLPTTPLGGHLVSGHVDGLGSVVRRYVDGRSERFEFRVPTTLKRYIAAKGAICIDGVSLTVNHVADDVFGVNIVPHTIENTIIGGYQTGSQVNLEVDMIARYLERLLLAGQAPQTDLKTVLENSGFFSK